MAGEQKVEDLLKEIDGRHLILPEFQRGYVWTKDQVRSFVTSLYRGYPSGSFLIWRTADPGKIRKMDEPDSDAYYFYLILDGQQRLTSLYTVMQGKPPPFYEGESLYFDLYFNLIDESFSYWKPMTMKGRSEWIPVTNFFQEGLARFIQLRSDGDEEAKKLYFDNLNKLQQLDALRSYPYYITTITEPRMDRVVEIFNLVNSMGTRLSKSDLALAYICSVWPEARGIFRDAQKRFAEYDFNFGLDFFTRATSTVATQSGVYEPLYRTSFAEIQSAWLQVEKVLEYLINLLDGNAFIEGDRDLKSPLPLITLINFLARNGGTFNTKKQENDFLHWLYAALMWGRYTTSSDTKLNADISVLADDQPAEQLRDNLLQQRGRIKVEPRDLARAGTRNAFYNMAYIVARSRGAVDWFSGQKLHSKAVGTLFAIEAHHIFPSSLLYKNGYSSNDSRDKQLVNEIANMAFVCKGTNIKISNKDPIGYLREVNQRFKGALEAQFVPMDEALWTIDRFEEFLAARRMLISDAINIYMDSLLAEPNKAETAIEDLIHQGEGKKVEFKASLKYDTNQVGIPQKVLHREVAKTLAAFLNSAGGTLLIGVADDGTVLGIADDLKLLGNKQTLDGFQLAFTGIVNSFLGGDIGPLIDLTFSEKEGETIAVAHCEPCHHPVFLREGDKQDFFVRSSGSSKQLNVSETVNYIKGRWQ